MVSASVMSERHGSCLHRCWPVRALCHKFRVEHRTPPHLWVVVVFGWTQHVCAPVSVECLVVYACMWYVAVKKSTASIINQPPQSTYELNTLPMKHTHSIRKRHTKNHHQHLSLEHRHNIISGRRHISLPLLSRAGKQTTQHLSSPIRIRRASFCAS